MSENRGQLGQMSFAAKRRRYHVIRRRRRLLRSVVAAVLVLAIAGAGFYTAARTLGWIPTSTEVESPPPTGKLTADELAYYEYVSPRVRELAEVTEELEELGEERSRNLVAIQLHGARMTTLVREIKKFREEHGTPARFLKVDQSFEKGADLTTMAMQEAQRGLFAFDWDRVAGAVETFDRGNAAFEEAVAAIDAAAAWGNVLARVPNLGLELGRPI